MSRRADVGAGAPDQQPGAADGTPDAAGRRGLTRRGVLGLAGAGAVGLGAGLGGARLAAAAREDAHPSSTRHAFHGRHQAGITTPVQAHLYFAAFDVVEGATREDVVRLLQEWTVAAEHLTRGDEVGETGAVGGGPLAPPQDTGEALGLGPHALTVTFGLGPSLFEDADGRDRFGIADRRPAALQPLPAFALELLEDPISHGDLCVQLCADDPQVTVHALRNLSRIAFGVAQVRWTQLGFGRTSRTTRQQQTPRNLFGFKDGTANIVADDTAGLDAHVWADDGWMSGGSYLVTRKIQMLVESWDRTQLQEQELVVGRDKGEGAPLSGGTELTEPDFALPSSNGGTAIAADAHVRLAHPASNGGVRLLRRGFNYVDGNNDLGQLDAGLFFISYQRDPQQFVTVQRSLASDLMNEYLRHVGSALFAVPPGVRPGQYVGQGLFES